MKIYQGQKGVAAVEFALVLPVLLLILFGIIEFGLVLYNKALVTNASREGARAGIVQASPRPNASQIQAVVTNYLATARPVTFGGPGLTTPTVSAPCAIFGQDLTVGVTYTYNFLVLPNIVELVKGTLTRSIDLVATTTMKCE